MGLILGIDTSCYTTSVALFDTAGNLLGEERKLLTVGEGERGLQQSAAVFQHIKNLPVLMEKLLLNDRRDPVTAVAASTRPRPGEGSYMPVFLVGESSARMLAEIAQAPFFAASHQEGHVMAGLWSADGPNQDKFLAVHLSGGTSELLVVERDGPEFRIEKIGGTTDLHAGQFVDRVGVALGLAFPCGPALQDMAAGAKGELRISSAVRGMEISFSGPETKARRLIEKGVDPVEIARAVEHCIAGTMEKLLLRGAEATGIRDVLLVGGVAANRYIRQRLSERLGHRAAGIRLYFAEPRFSSDNAVGAALIGLQKTKTQTNSQ